MTNFLHLFASAGSFSSSRISAHVLASSSGLHSNWPKILIWTLQFENNSVNLYLASIEIFPSLIVSFGPKVVTVTWRLVDKIFFPSHKPTGPDPLLRL